MSRFLFINYKLLSALFIFYEFGSVPEFQHFQSVYCIQYFFHAELRIRFLCLFRHRFGVVRIMYELSCMFVQFKTWHNIDKELCILLDYPVKFYFLSMVG